MENKVKFQAFGKMRKNCGQNEVKDSKECTECRGMEGGPQSAGELVTQCGTEGLEIVSDRSARNLDGMGSSGGLGEGFQPADELDNMDRASKMVTRLPGYQVEVRNHAGGLDDPLRSGLQKEREIYCETSGRSLRGESSTSRKRCNLARTEGVVKGLQSTTGLDEVSKRGLESNIKPAGRLEKGKRCEKCLTEEEKLMKSQSEKTEDMVNEIMNSTKFGWPDYSS